MEKMTNLYNGDEGYHGELFEGYGKAPHKTRFWARLKQWRAIKPQVILHLSVERVILSLIVILLGIVSVFAIGVEKGRHSNVSVSGPMKSPGRLEETKHTQQNNTSAAAAVQRPAAAAGALSQKPVESPKQIDKPYTIQIVAYKDKDSAEKKVVYLKGKGLDAFIVAGGDWFQVCINKYATKKEADQAVLQFKKDYKDCYVRKK